jgi:hypothetical protein
MGKTSRTSRGHRMSGALCGWIGLWLLLEIMGQQASIAAETTWPPKSFPITFWCGPPEPYITIEQYRRIVDAGFTVVMPPCEGASSVELNRKILDTAKRVGLQAIISDTRMPLSITGNPKAHDNLKAIVADYRKHPALMGYFLTDEPGANSFAGLAEVVADLRKLDPDHLAYINLYPNYASTNLMANPSQLNTDTYDQYLDRYLRTVQPAVLSWDHYHFLKSGDRPGFLANLASAQRAATATRPPTPFWQIVLSVQHGPYRPLNTDELRYEAMQTLVYGGKGLAYFTYWLPKDASFVWSHSIMNADGTPGPLYASVRLVNQEVKSIAKYLYHSQALQTFQTGQVPSEGRPQSSSALTNVVGAGDLSIGEFRGDDAFVYILVTNRDYKNPVSTKVALDVGKHAIERLDLATKRWHAEKGIKDTEDRIVLDLDLGPAGAILLRWQ